jgi:hypothetical protein
VLIGSRSDLDDAPNAFSPERRRELGAHTVEAADQMQIRGVHGRRLERHEQLVRAGVKVGLADESHRRCGVTETVLTKCVQAKCSIQAAWFGG